MFYTSTRDKSIKVTSSQAISHGISAEGGLFVPEEIPHITMDDIVRLADCDYIERAKEILSLYLTDFTTEEIDSCIIKIRRTPEITCSIPACVAIFFAVCSLSPVSIIGST